MSVLDRFAQSVLVHPWRVLAFAGLVLGGALYCLTTLKSDNSVDAFLAADDPQSIDRRLLAQRFGDSEILIGLADARRPLQEEDLRLLRAVGVQAQAIAGVSFVLHSQALGALALDALRQQEEAGRFAQAIRLSHAEQGHYAFVALTDRGDHDARLRIAADLEAVWRSLESHGFRVHCAGQVVLDRALDRAEVDVRSRLLPILVLVIALLLLAAYRDWRCTLAILLTVLVAEAASVYVLALFDQPLNLLTILLPVLILALGVALTTHVVTHTRMHGRQGSSLSASVARAMSTQFPPCLLTALTTALGFGSFGFSSILPLRVLGISMAVGLMLTFVSGFTVLPALLVLLRCQPRGGLGLESWLGRIVPRGLCLKRYYLAPATLLVTAGLFLLPRLEFQTNGLRYFTPTSSVRLDTAAIESSVMGSTSLELLLSPASAKQRDPLLARMHELLSSRPFIQGILSPQTLVPAFFHLGSASDAGQPAAPEDSALLEKLLRSYADQEGNLRLTVLLQSGGLTRPQEIEQALQAPLEDIAREFPGVQMAVTGTFPMILRVQDELLETLTDSVLFTFLAITAALGLLFRSVRFALAAVLPTAVPLAAIVVGCARLDIPLDIGTVMVFSVALGISVDDAIHVLHASRNGASVQKVVHQVGEAVTITTLARIIHEHCDQRVQIRRAGPVCKSLVDFQGPDNMFTNRTGPACFLKAPLCGTYGRYAAGLALRTSPSPDHS